MTPRPNLRIYTFICCAAVSREEECYRLTQRKSACRPVLMQGPCLLWPGQCPTVSVEAAGTQHRKQLSASTISLFFSLKITIFSLCCDFSFLACLSSAVTVHACFYFSTSLKIHTGFFNVTPLSVFKACGALFPGLYEVGLAKSIGRALPQKCHRYKVFPAQLGSLCHRELY